jgi:hypothetical protein
MIIWAMSRLRLHTAKYPNDGKLLSIFISCVICYLYSYRTYPDYFYTFTLWQTGGQQKLVDFVMIDTVLLCGGGNNSDWSSAPIDGPADYSAADVYWQWIEDQLRQST